MIRKEDGRPTLSKIAHRARLPNNRLKDRMSELIGLGLIDVDFSVTNRGYEFLIDFKKQMEPFLRKYEMGGRGRFAATYSAPPR
jgi:DNA-binding Lrp family transcriptional regulator